MKRLVFLVMVLALVLGACSSEADTASKNVSTAADQFQVERRVVFYNGITDTYMLTIEGRCSLGNYDGANELTLTCKTGPSTYKKHFLGLSDNVTYFVEQLEPAHVDGYRYKVIFRPEAILPDIDIVTRSSAP